MVGGSARGIICTPRARESVRNLAQLGEPSGRWSTARACGSVRRSAPLCAPKRRCAMIDCGARWRVPRGTAWVARRDVLKRSWRVLAATSGGRASPSPSEAVKPAKAARWCAISHGFQRSPLKLAIAVGRGTMYLALGPPASVLGDPAKACTSVVVRCGGPLVWHCACQFAGPIDWAVCSVGGTDALEAAACGVDRGALRSGRVLATSHVPPIALRKQRVRTSQDVFPRAASGTHETITLHTCPRLERTSLVQQARCSVTGRIKPLARGVV